MHIFFWYSALVMVRFSVVRFGYGMKRHVILLAYGRWFSRGTPASSTTKTGRHDIAEILLKVAL